MPADSPIPPQQVPVSCSYLVSYIVKSVCTVIIEYQFEMHLYLTVHLLKTGSSGGAMGLMAAMIDLDWLMKLFEFIIIKPLYHF